MIKNHNPIVLSRNSYKPFDYPWAYDLWKKHEAMHWLKEEVPLHEDVKDWNEKLNQKEKNLLTNLFRFFTQADVSVAGGYAKKFLPYFSGVPELTMMMSSFAAREAVHIDAYANLIETLGMPETTYSEFQNYKEMRDKNDYVEQFGMDTDMNVAKTLAVYSAFSEGMQLFASFVVLLNFARNGKMKNMGNIIAWSIRDEDMHVEGMTKVFKAFTEGMYDDTKDEWTPFLEREIAPAAYKMVELEDHFIDLIYKNGAVEGLDSYDLKKYIRYITNKRWQQLGFEGYLFNETKNPLPWVDYMVNGVEHSNFFESRPTTYSKASTKGGFEDIQW